MRFVALVVSSFFLSYVLVPATAVQCGKDAGGALCPGGLCCSQFGWCGTTDDYCSVEKGCQSNCTESGGGDSGGDSGGDIDGGALGEIITREMFDEIFPHRNDPRCHAVNFYTYDGFIAAAKSYPDFAATGDVAARKREVAAFLGQTSHETTGGTGWVPEDGPYYWGYCWNKEVGCPSEYCDYQNQNYPCVPGQRYCGRGPIQLSWNYNYGQYGETIGMKDQLLQNPDLLIRNVTMSFEASLWFWMTPQGPKPSCHDVILDAWTPSSSDIAAGRLPGYGVITNIINGGIECGKGRNDAGEDRIGYYKRYCDMFGLSYGQNLDCYNQRSFEGGLLVDSM